MSLYPDTSFLCALYNVQPNSTRATRFLATLDRPSRITTLLRFEFEQGVRAEIFRHERDRTKGYNAGAGMAMLANFETDLRRGILEIVPFDWLDVYTRATWLSEKHTIANGHRAFDILHVATALHLNAREFLTFDDRQRRLAEAEGLTSPL